MYEVVAKWGTPRIVITDSGPEYKAGAFTSLLCSMGIQHHYASAYHPQANGQVERSVQTILHSLQKAVGQHPETWDERLPLVMLGLRTTPHAPYGMSPANIMFGRHPRLPADLLREHTTAAGAPTLSLPNLKTEDPQVAQPTQPGPTSEPPPAQAPIIKQESPAGCSKPKRRTSAPVSSSPEELLPLCQEASPLVHHTPGLRPSSNPPPTQPPTIWLVDSSDDPNGADTLDPATKQFVDHRSSQQQVLDEKRILRNMAAQAKQQRDWQKRHLSAVPSDLFPAGSFVLMKSYGRGRNKMNLSGSCEGPYLLHSWENDHSCVLSDKTGKKWRCHPSRLHPYEALLLPQGRYRPEASLLRARAAAFGCFSVPSGPS